MKWITRSGVKVDRVACPWLIRKFVYSDAEFVFLPRDDWLNVKEGTVFDVPNCELGHHGEYASFDSILKIPTHRSDPALRLPAEIVRAADSHPSNPTLPVRVCAGWRTASVPSA